jgi:hypothetical protein
MTDAPIQQILSVKKNRNQIIYWFLRVYRILCSIKYILSF